MKKLLLTTFPLILCCLGILTFMSCSDSSSNSASNQSTFDTLKADNCEWIHTNTETIFVSDKQDTLSIEILNKNEGRDPGGSSVGAPDYTDYVSYDYRSNWKEESTKFLDLSVSSDDHVEFDVYFLNGQFDLADNKRNIAVPNFIYKNKPLKDVTIVGNSHIPPVQSDSTATQIWWSKSKGIVRFETRDNKTWSKV